MTIAQFLAVLRRQAVVVVTSVVVTTFLALALLQVTPKQYSATAVVDLSPALGGDSDNAATVSTTTEARIMTSLSVARLAAKTLKTDESPEALVKRVTATSPLSSEVLDVAYEASSAQEAAAGANAFAEAYLDYRSETTQRDLARREDKVNSEIADLQAQLDKVDGQTGQKASTQRSLVQSQIAQLQSQLNDYRTSVSDAGELAGPASVPTSASSPRPLVYLAGGVLVGLLVGIVLALRRDRRDDRVRSQDEVQAATGLPVLADIPIAAESRNEHGQLAALSAARGGEADAYRTVATTVSPGEYVGAPRTVLVCGTGRGKVFNQVPLNLAATFAMQGLRTVLAGTTESVGPAARLLDVRDTVAHPDDDFRARLRQPASIPNLRILPLGDEVFLGATLRANGNSLDAVLQDADVVVVDAANNELVSTALALGQITDAALVLVDKNRTRRADLDRTLNQLAKAGATMIGALLLSRSGRRLRPSRRRPDRRASARERETRAPSASDELSATPAARPDAGRSNDRAVRDHDIRGAESESAQWRESRR